MSAQMVASMAAKLRSQVARPSQEKLQCRQRFANFMRSSGLTLVMLRKVLGHDTIVTIRRRGWMLVNDAVPVALTLLDSYA